MDQFLKILLFPFSIIYRVVVSFRNFLFENGLRHSHEYDFPVICVGNLSVGGTGKTPHTEYLIRQLKENHQLAMLSRGYGRTTKGFKIADSSDNASTIGDEPFQIFGKFPSIIVAVDEKRKRGIDSLRKLPSPPQIVILDDAFQHRSVKAGLNVLLTDYSKLYINDFVLPSGRLREPSSGAKRADIIVVTKSPAVLSPLEIRRITLSLKPKEYQKVFFSYINYKEPVPLNEAAVAIKDDSQLADKGVLLVSAIANSEPLLLHLKRISKETQSINFKDHHFFSDKDYQKVKKQLDELLSPKKVIVITEKDAVKFDVSKFQGTAIFSIPIRIEFHQHQNFNFSEEIKNYVRSYNKSS